MNVENLTEKIRLLYSNQINEPTPVQIQKTIIENTFLNSLSDETGIVDIYLLKKIFHPDGKPMTYKAENFKADVQKFVEVNPKALEILKFIDEKSIRKDTGKLITRRIIKKFNNSKIT